MIDSSTIGIEHADGMATVTGSGSLDLHIADELRQVFKEASASGQAIVVDFRTVSYVDTAIVAALVNVAKTCISANRRVRVLVADDSHPQYVLKVMGMASLMDIEIGDPLVG